MPKESFSVASDVVPILYNKPWIKSSTSRKFIVENLHNIWCNLMHLKQSVMGLQIKAFKYCNKWTPVYKDYWRWKVYLLNKCWNNSIYLKKNGPHMKVPLIFWFLAMTFYFCFNHRLYAKWVCINIGNSSGHIGQTHSRFTKYQWMFHTE